MNEIHPAEKELGGEASTSVTEHLRWCARCRGIVADYDWLQGEIEATLVAAADAVPIPRPKWWAVQELKFASQRRRIVGGRISAVASVVLTVCLMLSISPVLGTTVVAQILSPEPVVALAPVAAAISGESLALVATLTPVISCEEATPSPTPAFVLPPTPPEPET